MNYSSPTPEEAVGYMRLPLREIEVHGDPVTSVLDVGAAHGHFARFIQDIFPEASVTCVECNEKDRYFLDQYPFEVEYACVGAKKGKATFYTNKDDEVGGGSSFYKECTDAFNNAVEEVKNITTLDDLFPNRSFDLIKIDTQGTEIEVMEGACNLLEKAKYLLLEMSFVEYNEGAPLIDEVLSFTRNNGFRLISTFGTDFGVHRWGSQAIQVDGLFAKDTLTNLLKFHAK